MLRTSGYRRSGARAAWSRPQPRGRSPVRLPRVQRPRAADVTVGEVDVRGARGQSDLHFARGFTNGRQLVGVDASAALYLACPTLTRGRVGRGQHRRRSGDPSVKRMAESAGPFIRSRRSCRPRNRTPMRSRELAAGAQVGAAVLDPSNLVRPSRSAPIRAGGHRGGDRGGADARRHREQLRRLETQKLASI